MKKRQDNSFHSCERRDFQLPFIISIPHCSGRVPGSIRSSMALSDEEILDSVDLGTKEVFGSIPTIAIVNAGWSRLVVDLNRSSHDPDPKGVIAKVDYRGRAIYHAGHIPHDGEVERRIKEYYFLFHNELKEKLDSPGIKGLFDCHSLCRIGPAEAPDPGKKRKDIVLGNNGDQSGNTNSAIGRTTCPVETMDLIKTAFQRAGFSVAINEPYSGGFIVTHYGGILAGTGKFAVQIEISQDLYLKPGETEPDPVKLEDIRGRVQQSFKEIAGE